MGKKSLGIIILLLVVLVGLYVGTTGPARTKEHQSFTIRPGTSARQIVTDLKSNNFIRSHVIFYGYLRLTGQDQNLRSGTYTLSDRYNIRRIARILQEKEGAASLTKVTIPEGVVLGEIAGLLDEKELVNADEFLTYIKTQAYQDLKSKFLFLQASPTQNLEGYLFPNTYIFAKGVSHQVIAKTFLKGFEDQIMPLWKKSSTNRLSLHQMLTLASIIEKETYDRSEMRAISAVFHNRLKKRMVLASCPTVAYAMGQPRKRLLTYKDLEFPSKYNTYRRLGLPPTPIAAPGVEAFQAALSPDPDTKYLYFVANGDGTHQFSYTLKSHLKKQKQIQKRLKNQKSPQKGFSVIGN